MTSSDSWRSAIVALGMVSATAVGVSGPAVAADEVAVGKTRRTASSLTSAASAEAERVALRDAIWKLEKSLRQRLVAAGRTHGLDPPGREPTISQLEALLEVLRESGRGLATVDGGGLARKADAVATLLREVKGREGAGAANRLSSSPWEPRTVASPLATLATTCADAVGVRDGRFAATIAPRAGGAGGEIWLRYTTAAAGAAMVSTGGSDFDTIVEVYRSCPAPGEAPVAHGDDELGLQARVSFRSAKGETTWIRIAGADAAAGVVAIELAGALPGLEGIVSSEETGVAVSPGTVQVWSANGSFVGSAYVYPDGSYLIALSPGNYFASTSIDYRSGLLDELYDDLPCAGGPPIGCSATAGTAISVPDQTVVDSIDFALSQGASIAGRVRDAATGELLASMHVSVYNAAGQLVSQTSTDSAGRFLVSGLAGGIAFATAGPSYGPYRRELYRDLACAPSCNVTAGTPIAVTEGQTTPNVDFALERLGAISGTLTRAATGTPVTNAQVRIWNALGAEVASAWTDGSGKYISPGVDAGQYFVTTQTWNGFFDELYDDVPCDPSCDPTTGTRVTVSLGNVSTGVDFALRQMGTISGELTDAATGDPLPFSFYFVTTFTVFDGAGAVLGHSYQYGEQYQITGLPAGTYYLRASHPIYRSEVYDDLPCPGNCDPTAGTPIAVTIDSDVTGIDFALTPLGSIAGTVVDSDTGAPIPASVRVWSSAGQAVTGFPAYDGSGNYRIQGLADGTYFVTASDADHAGELYDDIPCPDGPPSGCSPTSGTSVPVVLGTTTTGIDFALVRKGRIAGAVRDASTSQPLRWAPVRVFSGQGTQISSAYTDQEGDYEIAGLDAGDYFVVADAAENGYDTELFDDIACPNAACNPTIGTPVPVTLGATTTGIDFGLSRSSAITGMVNHPNGTPLTGAQVSLYDAGGSHRGSVSTNAQGRYALPAEPGTWYLLAYDGYPFLPQLYSGIDCPSVCDVTTGAPVQVASGVDTPDIDFTLSFESGIVGRVIDSGHPLPGVSIDLWNAAGQHVTSTVTAANGSYRLDPGTGTYFVSTDTGMDAIEEVWNDVPCPLGPAYQGLCDPTTGTPIFVSSFDALVSGVDFALEGVDLFVNGFEPGNAGWSAWSP